MKVFFIILTTFMGFSANVYAQDSLFIPKGNFEPIKHHNYYLSYSEQHEQAEWVSYELLGRETNAIFKRTNRFIEDPFVETGSAVSKDYTKTGFDRGHLAPAADMGFSSIAMKESFYMSNMSPQAPSFNRGVWKKLESKVRNWAVLYDSLYVVTAGVLSDSLPKIGQNGVSIPNFYYKIILDKRKGKTKMIGFLLPNKKMSNPLQEFVISVDSIESMTGIDFFPQLNDSLENILESSIEVDKWDFNAKNKILTEEKIQIDNHQHQCKGITQKGTRCKRKTLNEYCYQHD